MKVQQFVRVILRFLEMPKEVRKKKNSGMEVISMPL